MSNEVSTIQRTTTYHCLGENWPDGLLVTFYFFIFFLFCYWKSLFFFFNHLNPKSDQHEISPSNISAL